MDRRKVKIPLNGEKCDVKCTICGLELKGNAWSYKQLYATSDAGFQDIIGWGCANCGFAYCHKGHRKQVKAMGIKSIGASRCPDCGILMAEGIMCIITKKPKKPGAFEYREGLCMACGADEPLQKVTVWSGVEVEGKQLSPAITWMGIVPLIPEKREEKITKVQSKTLEVCKKCSRKNFQLGLLVENERWKKEGLRVVSRTSPFEQSKIEDGKI